MNRDYHITDPSTGSGPFAARLCWMVLILPLESVSRPQAMSKQSASNGCPTWIRTMTRRVKVACATITPSGKRAVEGRKVSGFKHRSRPERGLSRSDSNILLRTTHKAFAFYRHRLSSTRINPRGTSRGFCRRSWYLNAVVAGRPAGHKNHFPQGFGHKRQASGRGAWSPGSRCRPA